MNQQFISLQLQPLKATETAVAIKMANWKGVKRPRITTKDNTEVLIEFLQCKSTFNQLNSELNEAMQKALPKNVSDNCRKCKSELFDKDSYPPEDPDVQILGNCDFYKSQMLITYMLAANEFIGIVNRNWFIKKNKPFLKKLTLHFFSCFLTINGKGILAFDLSKFCNKLLEGGFLLISETFAKSNALQNLNQINDTLDSIDQSLIKIKLHNHEDYDRLELQREFFINKREYYKEKHWLNQHLKNSNPLQQNQGSHPRPTRTDIAYFCYYTSESKELNTKNHFPSKTAWEELSKRFNKSSTNIEKKYNEIFKSSNERLKSGRYKVIQYVLDNMLADYPKAIVLAREELKNAKLN